MSSLALLLARKKIGLLPVRFQRSIHLADMDDFLRFFAEAYPAAPHQFQI